MNKYDIMVWRGKSEDEKLKAVSRKEVPLPSLKGLIDKESK